MAFSLWKYSSRKPMLVSNKIKRISLYLYNIYYLIKKESIYNSKCFENMNGVDITLALIEENDNLNSKDIQKWIKELDKSLSKIKSIESYRNQYVTETFYKVISIENSGIQDDFENLYGNKMISYMYGIDISEGESFSHCKQINSYLELHNEEITYSEKKRKLPFENCVRIY